MIDQPVQPFGMAESIVIVAAIVAYAWLVHRYYEGLPWLNTGAIGGFVIGAILSAQPVMQILGL